MPYPITGRDNRSIMVYSSQENDSRNVRYGPRVIFPGESTSWTNAQAASFFSAADARNNPMQRRTFTRRMRDDYFALGLELDYVIGCFIVNFGSGLGVQLFQAGFERGKLYGGIFNMSPPMFTYYPETLNAKQCSVVCDPQGRIWLFVGLSTNQVKCYAFASAADMQYGNPPLDSYVVPGPSVTGSPGAAPWSVAINDAGTIMLAYADGSVKKIYERHVDATDANVALSAWTAASQVNAIGATGTNSAVGSVAVEGGPGRTFHVMFQMATDQMNDPPNPSADPFLFYQRTTNDGASWMSRESLVDDAVLVKDVRGYFSFAAKDTGEVFYCRAGAPAGRSAAYYHPNPQPTPVNGYTDWYYAEMGAGFGAVPTYVEAFVDRDGNFGELMLRVPGTNGNTDGTNPRASIIVRRSVPIPGNVYFTNTTETVLQMLPSTLYSAYGVHNLMPLVFSDGRRRITTDMPGFFLMNKDLDHWASAMDDYWHFIMWLSEQQGAA